MYLGAIESRAGTDTSTILREGRILDNLESIVPRSSAEAPRANNAHDWAEVPRTSSAHKWH